MAGYYKSGYVDADGKKKIMSNTQFEALDARRAFPCWDEPAVKATFSVSLTIPSGLTALSNMPDISSEYLPGGKKKVTFATSPIMSTYLLAWAVGEFDFVQATTKSGVCVRVYCPPGRSHQGFYALDIGKRCLELYDEFFQVPYPLPKLDMICCTEFAMGAMENWGLVTYREVDLMIEEHIASSQQKQRVSTIVCHELAHQWFGNLVTMEWWNDLWLNEGFATYMMNFATNELFPSMRIWETYTVADMTQAYRLDSLRSSHPIQVPIRHAEEVEQVFDAISYQKGSAVVRMVAAFLGPEHFRSGLQLYMKRHQYSNTITTDLWAAWSEVSGKDVCGLMTSWTNQMGYPYLSVVDEKWEKDRVTITLEQQWFLGDGSTLQEEEAGKTWCIPLLFATDSSDSSDALVMKEKRQTFTIPLSNDNDDKHWLRINTGQKALIRVINTPEMTKRLGPAIAGKLLCAEDRAGLLLDAYALCKAGYSPLEHVVTLLKWYGEEDSAAVWSALEGVLNGLYLPMEVIGGSAFTAFCTYAKRMVRYALDRVGWEAKEGVVEGHTDNLKRATIMSLVELFCYADDDVLKESRKRFDAHWENPAALSTDLKTIVYRIVLRSGSIADYERVLASFYATEDNSVRKVVMLSLGAISDPKLQLRTLDWAIKGSDIKLQDFFYPIRSVAFVSAESSALAWDYLKTNMSLIKTKLASASPSLMAAVIIYGLCRHCTLDQAAEVEKYFQDDPIPSAKRAITQTLEAMRSNGQMVEKIKTSSLASPSAWE
eukprot:CAMPEP_0182426326 /NCGR_PEP_ID=MMETSP1167-20130531/12807_1 /TAXON_ID=2988 /ORGANISM="Mallomonas Sp, Strain CCMP3275" /LENGTH=769 /DNA_ID=CAMNT_0024607665 /DNA_START=333 /DNA_END=2642 /DNA_ORIENTATION=+